MRDCTIILGDKIYKNAWGFKECAQQFRFHLKGEIKRAKNIIKEYCEKYSCTCAELCFFNKDCTVKCWFIYECGKLEKFV